jgi:5-methylcytosine-specific restriction enzyme subunit McrC
MIQPLYLEEYSSRECDPDSLLTAANLEPAEMQRAFADLVEFESDWSKSTITVRSNSKIGTIQVNGLRIDVRPRLAADELAILIRYAFGASYDGLKHSTIGMHTTGLDELLCRVFADELAALRQRGLSRRYVQRHETLAAVRGRPSFTDSFPWNDDGMTSINCRFHELSCDNLDNRLIRAALEFATLMETTAKTRQRLLEHRYVWSEISSWCPVSLHDFLEVRRRYNRLTEHYCVSHNLAEVIFSGCRPSDVFAQSNAPTRGISLDMANLFERFVERFVREILHPKGYLVQEQQQDQTALLDDAGYHYRAIRPDLVVYRDGRARAVIDAKYKNYWAAAQDGQPLNRIANEDLYQLFFYAQRLHSIHQSRPAAVIVVPLPAHDELLEQPIGSRFRTITCPGPEASSPKVSLLLLPLTDILRALRRGTFDLEMVEPVARQISDLMENRIY